MNKKFNQYFISTLIIFIPVIAFLTFRYFYPDLMEFDNLFSSLENLYSKYGIYIIFLGGIIESLFLLNLYAPGSFVILLGAVLAASGVVSLPIVIIAGTAGLIVGYSIDYLIGAKGWHELLKNLKIFRYVETGKEKLKEGSLVIFLSAVHPNPASFVSLAAGISNYDFKKFILIILPAQLFWSTFWGVIFYTFGVVLLQNMIVAALLAIIIISFIWFSLEKARLGGYLKTPK